MSRWDGFPNSWGYKRAGRESGRGRRRKQTCVCVKPVSSERANKEIFCQVTSETARVEKKRSLVVKGVAIGEAGGHEVEEDGVPPPTSSPGVSGEEGGVPPPEDSLGESSVPAGQGSRERLLVDIGQLANILTQARGPILARITQLLATRFGGSGRLSGSGSVDVTEWVECLEGMCRLENVSPADIIGYVLEGNASRIYGRMMVGDASQWAVVKAALLGEYALPRGLVSTNVLSASCARDVTTRKSSVGFEGLAERMARAYRGHHPLLAVFQPSKDKVRPVMDYRELNDLSNAILAI
ncbi:hypothetical protein GQR58_028122 [Nymphon striatum]|nr:hypothetical protein GQR58_028122 [Nymphon striatum]